MAKAMFVFHGNIEKQTNQLMGALKMPRIARIQSDKILKSIMAHGGQKK